MTRTPNPRAPLVAALCLLAAGAAAPAHAADVTGLYEAQAPVAGRAEADREAALRTDLLEVVVKVSGSRTAGEDPAVVEAARAPGRFVQQYQYRGSAAATGGGLTLWARFDSGEVDALLRGAGLPVWGRTRPSVLAWIAVENGGTRTLLGADDGSGIVQALRRAAAARALPLDLPLLDLEDRARVHAADVWEGFDDRIRAASARYASEAILVGRIAHPVPELWEGRWTLLLPDGAQQWTDHADQPEFVAEAAANEAADRLAARYATAAVTANASDVQVVVAGVDDFAGYARTLDYLGGLEGVTRVYVAGVATDRLRLRVEARGGADALRQVIGLGTTLAPDVASAAETGVVRLRLLP